MGGKGQASKSAKSASQSQSQATQGTGRSRKANIVYPVGRIQKQMKRAKYAERVSSLAAVSLAAILEYLTAEILELAGNAARDNKKGRINPRYTMMAIQMDDELQRLFHHVTISEGGVLPNINPILLPKKSGKVKAGNEVGQSQREGQSQAAANNTQSQEV